MPDSKKKRPRKRQRKSKGADVVTKAEEDEEEERAVVTGAGVGVEAGASAAVGLEQPQENPVYGTADILEKDNGNLQPSAIMMTGSLAGAAGVDKGPNVTRSGGGPTLSFYQRTNPHKPSALSSLRGDLPRRYTVSVAIPGSIILNAQSPELQSRLAGQLARSCAIFNIDEIVVYNELNEGSNGSSSSLAPNGARAMSTDMANGAVDAAAAAAAAAAAEDKNSDHFDPNAFLARILQYVETPQYLRKSLFPMHRDLRMAGILAPLDCPHHLRYEEESEYREGVSVEPPHWAADKTTASTWVYTGLRDPVQCIVKGKSGERVPLGARVTVKMPSATGKKVGHIVSPREPVQEKGLYWGYTTRLCNSLSEAISSPCWNAPYDLVIGTSERGTSLTNIIQAGADSAAEQPPDQTSAAPPSLSPYHHALIVFGGLSGLEVAVEADANINLSADDASELFDAWINVVEGQGSRTIRTEEALLITLARLKTTLETLGQR